MKILAFAASNSRQSINGKLLAHAIDVLKTDIHPEAEVTTLDLNDYEMPIYSIDRERLGGLPAQARDFYDKITAADALLISYAEHNGFYTAAFKNVFDWASRISMRVFQDKPMVIMSASIGRDGGANVMRTALDSAPHFGADIKASLMVGSFKDRFDVDAARLSDPDLAAALHTALRSLNTVQTTST